MGFLKKVGKTFKKGWKDALGWADDDWMKDYVMPVALTVAGAYFGGPLIAAGLTSAGASASAASVAGASIAGSAAGGTYQSARASHLQDEAQKEQLAAMRDIAKAEAAAAAVPIATEAGAQQVTSAETSDINNATERRRALSTADTTSGRLQRWARNGKRKTLG